MLKILANNVSANLDSRTILDESIRSIDLMERAANAFVSSFKERHTDKKIPTLIFCGVGNNGGDGLAIARLLYGSDYSVRLFTIGSLQKASPDFSENFKRLPNQLTSVHLESEMDFPLLSDHELLIDGLFGSGLNRPVEGLIGQLIDHLNSSGAEIISIDIASGLVADQHSDGRHIIQPAHTISFQLPKLAFFLPENEAFVGHWSIADIGLSSSFIAEARTNYFFIEESDIKPLLPIRSKFAHKGEAGRLLIVAGGKGKIGAAILAARAGLRTGVGLMYLQAAAIGHDVLQTSVPEAMVLDETNSDWITPFAIPEHITAIALGPGIGTHEETGKALLRVLKSAICPLVLDADAINLVAENLAWKKLLPRDSILTPHPGEFRRLVGPWKNDFHRLELLRTFCKKHHVHVVLKGAHSAMCHPNGNIIFNSTGNPGMATGGSGDVLTGILGALLAQGLDSGNTLELGVYLHGFAGDLAKEKFGMLSLTASDIIDQIPAAIVRLN